MPRLLLLASLCLVAAPAFACGAREHLRFDTYEGGPGPAAQVGDTKVTIETSFLASLEAKPDGAVYSRHSSELLYLLSVNDPRAIRAGVRVLGHLIAHPTIVGDCGGPSELYGKQELAYELSRTTGMNRALCALPPADRKPIVAFYAAHPRLWNNVDEPWIHYSCEPIEVTP